MPNGWSRQQYIRYVVIRIMFFLYVGIGLFQIGLAGCMAFLEAWEYMGHLFRNGCIMIFVSVKGQTKKSMKTIYNKV